MSHNQEVKPANALRSPQKQNRSHLLRRVTLLGVLLIALMAVYGISELNHYAHERVTAKIPLAQSEKVLHQLKLLQEQVETKHELAPDHAEQVQDLFAQLASAMDALAVYDSGPTAQHLRAVLAQYQADLRVLFKLLSAEDYQQADAWDEQRVDPGYETARQMLVDADAVYQADAERAHRWADVGTILGIFLALLAIGFIFRRSELALRKSEATNHAFLAAIPDLMFQLNRKGVFLNFHAEKEQELLAPPSAFLGKHLSEVLPPDIAGQLLAAIQRVLQTSTVQILEYQLALNGEVRDREARVVVCGEDEVLVLVRDITERKQAEQERMLRQSEARFRLLVQNASDMVALLDAQGSFCYASPSFERVLGYKPDHLQNTNAFALVHAEDLVQARGLFGTLLETPGFIPLTELRVRHYDGSCRYIEVVGNNSLDDPSVAGIVLNIRDITERKAFEAQLQHQAFHDPLTNLPNRALFMDRLQHALVRATRQQDLTAVLFIDLDRFKVVNDSIGHKVGDQLLASVAQRLETAMRTGDTAARLGGDEFVVLLEGLGSVEDAAQIAERIMDELRTPVLLGEHEVLVTPSIGIAVSQAGAMLSEDLLRQADVAMYQVKRNGKAHYRVFDPSMDGLLINRMELEQDLRLAIARGELEVYYQPIVRLADGCLVGVEALVRWRHTQHGLVSLAEFIPLAEETGLIIPIGRWILQEACRQAKQWHTQYPAQPPLFMSVNLSARQLQHPKLIEDVAQILDETGVDAETLKLEITKAC